jgi:outer membrane biogenesis lipoprotein LolB
VRQLLACGLLALAGCAALEPSPALPPQLAAAPRAFEMSGRISVRVGERNDIARLRWTHQPASDAWVVSSPIGNEVARIDADGSGAVLRRAGAPEERSSSFEALSERLFGAALDPAALAAWLHGAKPEAAHAGWNVTIDESQRAGAVELAKRITATRGDTVVKLVVDGYRPLGD